MTISRFKGETDEAKVLAGFVMGLFVAPAFWDVGLYSSLLHADAAEWFAAVGTFVAAGVALWVAGEANRQAARDRDERERVQLEVAAAIATGVLIEVKLARNDIDGMVRRLKIAIELATGFPPSVTNVLSRIESETRQLSFVSTEGFVQNIEYLPHFVRIPLMELVTYKPQVVVRIIDAIPRQDVQFIISCLTQFDKSLVKAENAVTEFIGPKA